jgi:uncharacterized membrane protein YvbJ
VLYKCRNGHISEIEYGDKITVPCPECGDAVHKFKALYRAPAQTAADEPIIMHKPSALLIIAKKHVREISIGASALLLVIAAIYFYSPIKATVADLVTFESAPEVVAVHEYANNISQVNLKNLKVIPKGDNVKISFSLVNTGDNDYPSLVLHWRSSETPDLVILKDAYPNTGKFTKLPVEFEVINPNDATGLEVKVQYPPKASK